MPQPSYAYACARLSALNKRLIEPQTIQRMLDGSASDAMRALSDVRYGNLSDATEADIERMIEREMTDAMQEVRELSPNPAITDLYLLRADVQNLKVLLKARLLNQSDTVFTPGGLFDRETLSAMVKDRQYDALPEEIRDAMNTLEKRLEIRVEPQAISIALDRAYLAHALKASAKHPVFSQYFKAEADFDNVLTFLAPHEARQAAQPARVFVLGVHVQPVPPADRVEVVHPLLVLFVVDGPDMNDRVKALSAGMHQHFDRQPQVLQDRVLGVDVLGV